MEKFFVTLFLILSLSSASYGAASEDTSVYLRKDVFEAKMDSFMNEIRGEFKVVNAKIEALNKRMDDYQASMSARIDDFQKSTSARFDDLQTSTANRFNDLQATMTARIDDSQATTTDRIDDLKTIVYWGLSILGLLIAFAIFAPSFGEFLRNLRKPSVTLEDVKRLIEEAKLSGTPQGVRLPA